ncbi:MAG: SAM-dependent methyltransferase [Roseburia sp.]|nr:SAM-dependent methyltransferase [Roseburia sp.]
MIKISERLTMAASLVTGGGVLADVGTDHGYVPIYLIEKGIIPRAIAMDINPGPLERAKEHIAQYGMGEYIQTRLSDGVSALSFGEADSILIAGMGGGLVMHILEDGEAVCQNARELVLQPQSELARVRRFLYEKGYVTDAEEMVEEEGKFYPMMRVHYDASKGKDFAQSVYFAYGQILLESRHPVLREFLEREQQLYKNILEKLKKQPQTDIIANRIREIKAELEQNEEALTYYR